MILYVNCCIREESRTEILAEHLLSLLDDDYEEIHLESENILPLDCDLLKKRNEFIINGDYSHSMFSLAKQFANADRIVISAPFWDLSFPAKLKIYIENIFVNGITFRYSEEGIPVGLCKAKELYFVSTAGGAFDKRFGYDYIKTAAENMLGIKETHLVFAEMLDVFGYNPDEILQKAIDETNKKYGHRP